MTNVPELARTLAADLETISGLYRRLVAEMPPEAWPLPTEKRDGAWTTHATLAHVVAVARTYTRFASAAASGQPAIIDGLAQRRDLRSWNQAQIRAGVAASPAILGAQLEAELAEQITLARQLDLAQLAAKTTSPVYNADLSTAELLGGSIVHLAIVHGAQIMAGLGAAPLWQAYEPAFFRRVLGYFFVIMGATYWPERGGDLRATIAFEVGGPAAGIWHLAISNGQAIGRSGPPAQSDLRLRFRDAAALADLVTFRSDAMRLVFAGKLWASGDLLLAARFPRLFGAT